jgi:lactobin A/cerein 7B family class IIb bacteriocin
MNAAQFRDVQADELAQVEGGIAPLVVGAWAVLGVTAALYGGATALWIRAMLR